MGSGRRRVVWTQFARDTLNEAIAYIADDSPTAAQKVLTEIVEITTSLAELSERGRMVPELEDEAVREVFAHSYRVIYRVSPKEVQILALVHQARDFERWRQEEE